MRVAIVGGKLQGVEATYLAKKAGWEVVLFDRREQAQASKLADFFVCIDVLYHPEDMISQLDGVDFILPACEDKSVLNYLKEVSRKTKIPLAFHPEAYSVSSSKLISNRLFSDLGISVPKPWPYCDFPILVKPSDGSGSVGVRILSSIDEYQNFICHEMEGDWVIEEFVKGPSYSIEVFGFGGDYRVFEITELEMDSLYDCKRVLAPVDLDYKLVEQFEEIAVTCAKALSLNGIMDVETILHNGELKVLEIDARLPSQTPSVVYHSSGINMVECIGYSYIQGSLYVPIPRRPAGNERYVIYEHIKVTPEEVIVAGEHIMTEAGPLDHYFNFFGADEALSDFAPGKSQWVATLITRGVNQAAAWIKRNEVIKNLMRELRITDYQDLVPHDMSLSRSWKQK